MAEFDEILSKVTDESVRNELKAKYNEVNQVKGEYGNKLITKDQEINNLKAEKQTYSKAADALKKSGVEPDQIPKLLEKLGYQKTLEEEHVLVTAALQEKAKAEAELKKENARLKAEKAMARVFENERQNFKDDKGQPIKLAEKFINYDKLYDVSDFTNEAVLQEKCKQVLNEGFVAQTEVLRQVGFVGIQTHTTPDGKQTNAPVPPDFAKIMKEHGAPAAIQAIRDFEASKNR